MPRFRYSAVDKSGLPVSGEQESADRNALAALLEAKGWRIERIELLESGAATEAVPKTGADSSHESERSSTAREINCDELTELGGRIADIANSNLPLAAGLRTISEETGSRKLRAVLLDVSQSVESGQSLDEALASGSGRLPTYLAGLIRAGIQTGRLGPLLEQYLYHARVTRDLLQEAHIAMVYPAIVLVAAIVIVLVFLCGLVPAVDDLFGGFDYQVPTITGVLFALADAVNRVGPWILLGLTMTAFALWFVVSRTGGRPLKRRLFCLIPVLGPLYRNASLAEFCHFLAMLLENRVPLPEALRQVAPATHDAELEAGSLDMARAVEAGAQLDEAAQPLTQFPPSLLQIFGFAGHAEALPAALHAVGDAFQSKARMQSNCIRVLAGPMVVFGVALTAGMFFVAYLLPMVKFLGHMT